MKILFLSTSAQGGGAEAALLELIHELRETRPDWPLHLLCGEDGPMLGKARSAGVPCEVVEFSPSIRELGENRTIPGRNPSSDVMRAMARLWRLMANPRAVFSASRYAYRLRKRLRDLKPDVLHANGMKMQLLAALAGLGTSHRPPLLWHLHDYLSPRATMAPILRRLGRCCQLAVANSESVALDAQTVLPRNLRVKTVYNTIDSTSFTPIGPRLDLDQLAGLPPAVPGAIRVGLVATFAFWKGHCAFLRAIARTKKNGLAKTMRFYVVGGPLYTTAGSQYTLDELRDLASELEISDLVGFTGFVEDIPAAMRTLDIVVHASTQPEPFGLVIVQAMACGRALIVSAAGGARELVETEVDSLAHSPGNIEELSNAIERLAADRGLRERLGAAGRCKVKRQFTGPRMAAGFMPLYEDLLLRCR